ncbi:MAG: hypothetical protein HKN47_01605, partial [Pirellulaceae bacterium]|nr:hypothetical protein [Pirellulaceae bacterium]
MDLTKFSTTITGVLLVVVVAWAPTSTAQPIPIPVPITQATSYFDAVELHFDRLIHYSLDRYGATRSGLWVSSIDIHTNELIQLPSVAAEESDRHFVRGAHLYWDQPMLVAAEAIAEQSGCKCYS